MRCVTGKVSAADRDDPIAVLVNAITAVYEDFMTLFLVTLVPTSQPHTNSPRLSTKVSPRGKPRLGRSSCKDVMGTIFRAKAFSRTANQSLGERRQEGLRCVSWTLARHCEQGRCPPLPAASDIERCGHAKDQQHRDGAAVLLRCDARSTLHREAFSIMRRRNGLITSSVMGMLPS